jgi:hypothetical protein
MPYQSIITQKRTGSKVANREWKVTCTRHRIKGADKLNLFFTIGSSLIKKLGWLKGDKIDILVDPEDKTALMRRTTDNGISLTINNLGHGSIRVSGIPGELPKQRVEVEHQIVDNEIIFDICWG